MSRNYDLQDYEKYFEDINNLIYKNLDSKTIEYISSQVEKNVFSKFYQMKEDEYFTAQQNLNKKSGFISYSLALVFSSVIVMFGIVTFITLRNINKDIQTTYSIDNNKIEVSSINRSENIQLSTSNETLFIYLPETIEGIISVSPNTKVKSIVVYIGNTKYVFQASKFNINVSDKKLLIDGKEVQPVKEDKYKNIIFLKDGSQFEGNLIEIKDEFIIFDTKDGRKKFQKKDIDRIKYSD
ncbi:MAG: hypothetical protein N3D81_06695 [Spirochaetes bacterium]|nr:hypothetical protein [Spirochaetota bacterium]